MLKSTSIHEESFNNDENLIQTLELVNINAMVISSADEIGNKSHCDLLFIHISSQSNIDHNYLNDSNFRFFGRSHQATHPNFIIIVKAGFNQHFI